MTLAGAQPFSFAGFSGFMLLTTLYFQEYLELSLKDTAVSLYDSDRRRGKRSSPLELAAPFHSRTDQVSFPLVFSFAVGAKERVST